MFKAVGVMAIISAFTILLSLANSVIFAHFYGTSRDIEVYFAVLVLFSLVYKLTQTGQLAELFLPRYNNIKSTTGKVAALHEFAIVVNQMSIFTLTICTVLFVSKDVLIDLLMPGFDHIDRELGSKLFSWLIPLIFCQVLSSLFKIILMAEEKYILCEFVDFFSKLIQIVFVLLLVTEKSVWPLLWAVGISMIFKTLVMTVFLVKEGFKFKLGVKNSEFNFFSPMLNFYRYVGVTQIFAFVLTSAATLLPQGYFAVYKYVENIYNAMNNVITRPIGQVFFSKFSKAYSEGKRELNQLGRRALNYVLLLVVIILVPYVSAGDLVFSVMWYGENFTLDKVELAYFFIMLMFPVILIDAVSIIARRVVVSIGYVNKQYNYMAIAQVLSAFFAFYIIPLLGLNGVIATLIVNKILLTFSSLIILKINEPGFLIFFSKKTFLAWVPIVGVSIALALLAREFLFSGDHIMKGVLFLDASLITLVALSSVFGISYMLGVKETRFLFGMLKKGLSRA